jgi:hypothetical protein
MMGFFVRTDIPYFRPMSKTGLKSSGWGDLDILAVGPDKERYLVQVKGWHTEAFTPSYFGGTPWVDTLAKKEAARVFESNEFKTILVVSGIGSRSENEVRRLAKAEQYLRMGMAHLPLAGCWVRNAMRTKTFTSSAVTCSPPSFPSAGSFSRGTLMMHHAL